MTASARSRSFRWSISYKDLAVSVSLASLLLLQVWRTAEQVRSPQSLYFSTAPANPALEVSALLNTALFACILLLLIGFLITGRMRDQREPSYRAPAAAGCFVLWHAVAFLASQLAASQKLGNVLGSTVAAAYVILLILVLPGLLVLSVVQWPRQTWTFVQTTALIFFPFSVLRVSQTTWQIFGRPVSTLQGRNAPAVGQDGPRKPLVLWLVFDELDQSAAFGGVLGRIDLPNLTRLRETAVHVEHACETADDTAKSIPSYVVGRPVGAVRWDSSDDLMLRFAGAEEYVSWAGQRTLFHEANAFGRRTAILGSYHPYCRLFGNLTRACRVFPDQGAGDWMQLWSTLQAIPLYKAVLLQADRALPGFRVVRRFDGKLFRLWQQAVHGHVEQQHVAAISLMRRALLELLADPELDFVFAHIPLPHPPDLPYLAGFENRPVQERGYVGNLQATDYLLGEIFDVLRSSGRWASAAVVLTSDHGVRNFWRFTLSLSPSLLRVIDAGGERTVPLVVKLPYQTESIAFLEPLDAIHVYGIVRGLLRGELARPAEVVRYLDSRAAGNACPAK